MSDRTPETGSHAWMVRMTAEREEAEDRKPIITEPVTPKPQPELENWDTVRPSRERHKQDYLDRRHTHIPTQTEKTTPED